MEDLRTSCTFFPHRPKVSLARALSKLGYYSRARALEMIEEGRVKVNRLGDLGKGECRPLTREQMESLVKKRKRFS